MLRRMHENARENLSQGCWKLPCNSPGTVMQTLRLAYAVPLPTKVLQQKTATPWHAMQMLS